MQTPFPGNYLQSLRLPYKGIGFSVCHTQLSYSNILLQTAWGKTVQLKASLM